jgi:hypothetical protein
MGGFFGSSMAVKPGGQWDVIKTAPSVVRAALGKRTCLARASFLADTFSSSTWTASLNASN